MSTSEHPRVQQPETGEEQHQDEVGGDEVGGLVVGHDGYVTPSPDKRLQGTEGSLEQAARPSPT